MELGIKDKIFAVTGATSGFGRATAERLLMDGATVIANARRAEKLDELEAKFPGKVIKLCGDIVQENTRNELVKLISENSVDGIFINAGGPPAGGPMQITMDDLDLAYQVVLKWKVDLTQKLVPYFEKRGYGRLVYLESSSIKQPIENLVLSNSFRMAVAGFVKTISAVYAAKGITFNILAPGYHETAAVQRIFDNKAKLTGLSPEEIKKELVKNTPVQKMGNPDDLGSLAAWLLSPLSNFVTGNVYVVDGGVFKGNL